MALSGSYYSYPVSSFGLYVEWSATQSVTGNYSSTKMPAVASPLRMICAL